MINAKPRATFDTITNALETYNRTVSATLSRFESDCSDVKKRYAPYKEADRLTRDGIRALIPAARTAILQAGIGLSDSLNEEIETLGEFVLDSIIKPVPEALRRQLDIYRITGLKPGKSEINGLLVLNGGNWLGFRCIDQLLKQTDSEYAFDFRPIETFEKDLETLRQYSAFVRFNPSLSMSDLSAGMHVFCDFGAEESVVQDANGDNLEFNSIAEALPIRDAAGNDTPQRWTSALMSAEAGRHDQFARDIEAMRGPWVQPDIYPEPRPDPAKQVQKTVGKGTAKDADGIIEQYSR